MAILDLSWKNWDDEVLKSKILTLVYFWHDECPWCRTFSPIFENVSREYEGKVKFVKINIFESEGNMELAENLGIMATPTLMFFCEGRPIMQVIGAMTDEELRKTINEALKKYASCVERSTKLSYIM